MNLNKKISAPVGYTVIAIASLIFIGLTLYMQTQAEANVADIIAAISTASITK